MNATFKTESMNIHGLQIQKRLTWTFIATILWFSYLKILQHFGYFPKNEDSFQLHDLGFDPKTIDLPIEISFWWSMLVVPMFFIVWLYYLSQEKIAGAEPDEYKYKPEVIIKYRVRNGLFLGKGASLLISILMLTMFILFVPLFKTGIVVSLIASAFTFIGMFCGTTIISSFATGCSVSEFREKLHPADVYFEYATQFNKMGILIAFLSIPGLTLGYLAMKFSQFLKNVFRKKGTLYITVDKK